MQEEFHDCGQRMLKKPKERLRKGQKDLETVMCEAMPGNKELKKQGIS